METAHSHQEQIQQHQMLELANYLQPVLKQIRIKQLAIPRAPHACSPQPQLMEHLHALLTIAQLEQVDLHAKQSPTLIYPNIRYVY
mgnify:CR=1 FL=1